MLKDAISRVRGQTRPIRSAGVPGTYSSLRRSDIRCLTAWFLFMSLLYHPELETSMKVDADRDYDSSQLREEWGQIYFPRKNGKKGEMGTDPFSGPDRAPGGHLIAGLLTWDNHSIISAAHQGRNRRFNPYYAWLFLHPRALECCRHYDAVGLKIQVKQRTFRAHVRSPALRQPRRWQVAWTCSDPSQMSRTIWRPWTRKTSLIAARSSALIQVSRR